MDESNGRYLDEMKTEGDPQLKVAEAMDLLEECGFVVLTESALDRIKVRLFKAGKSNQSTQVVTPDVAKVRRFIEPSEWRPST